MKVHTWMRYGASYASVTDEDGVDLHWLLDDGSTHVVILNDERNPDWYVVNRGCCIQEGPFDTVEAAVIYCNLRYTPVDKILRTR